MRVKRVRRDFSETFIQDAVALVERTGRPYRQLAFDLGISETTLRGWYDREMAKKSKAKVKGKARVILSEAREETTAQRLERLERENRELRGENDTLREEREILKKAAAFFAKEST